MESGVNRISFKWVKTALILMLLFAKAHGMCPSGYLDIDSNSEFCFIIPFLHNNPNNVDLHPNNGRTWEEAQELCQENGGGNLASFESEEELEILISFLKNIYIIREMFRDYTKELGFYLPENSTLCPEPPIGCALWYFGLRRNVGTDIFRYINV